ncbi:hypothetical protein H0H87_005174 [Tephrocybe sp. NHM501043]|nr:hypothetical protein H0H87_005174 [Tephrocybe sp. NHM501043]
MYIAVHGGAGMHSQSRDKEVKHALRLACKEALKTRIAEPAISDGLFAASLDTVGNAIAILEDDSHLNAGYGSNLTLEGTVECDAAVMDGNLNFGSVGAVLGVKNPIWLARAVLEHSKVPDPLGRIPPLTLVGDGAHSFATAKSTQLITTSVETVRPESMISPKARDDWMKWKARLEGAASVSDTTISDSSSMSLRDIQDTVGAVAYGHGDTIATGVSRLECIMLKAAMFGAGCWAQEFPESGIRIACSLSGRLTLLGSIQQWGLRVELGAGEHIARSMLAREIGHTFSHAIAKNGNDVDAHDILHKVLLEKFWTYDTKYASGVHLQHQAWL